MEFQWQSAQENPFLLLTASKTGNQEFITCIKSHYNHSIENSNIACDFLVCFFHTGRFWLLTSTLQLCKGKLEQLKMMCFVYRFNLLMNQKMKAQAQERMNLYSGDVNNLHLTLVLFSHVYWFLSNQALPSCEHFHHQAVTGQRSISYCYQLIFLPCMWPFSFLKLLAYISFSQCKLLLFSSKCNCNRTGIDNNWTYLSFPWDRDEF